MSEGSDGGREKEKVYAIIDQGDEETFLNLRAHGSSAYVGIALVSLSLSLILRTPLS